MSYPILYAPATTDFANNGIGMLSDAITCTVSEERNGLYELEMDYPIGGVLYAKISNDCILRVPASQRTGVQAFRVYKISKPLSGVVSVSAQHISYQLSSIPVSPFDGVTGAAAALSRLIQHAAAPCPYTVWTDVATDGKFSVAAPSSLRSLLGGVDGSILDVFGGEYEFDNYAIKLHKARGEDRGVRIEYGKNLIDMVQEENISSLCTGIYPYWADSEGAYLELDTKVIQIQSDYSYPRIKPLDLSGEFEEMPTQDALRKAAEKYIDSTELRKPAVSLTVDFVPIWQTDEYKNDPLYKQVAGLETLGLCDTVTVKYTQLGVDCTAKIVAYEWDSLADRYNSMTIGNATSTLASTIIETQAKTEGIPTPSKIGKQIAAAQKLLRDAITGAEKGHVVINFGDDGSTAEILIMDTDDKATCRKCMRANQAGVGFSTNGYNGPFNAAVGLDGALYAAWISTWQLTANIITAGVLQSQDGETFYLDLEKGILRMNAKALTVDGDAIATQTWAQSQIDVSEEGIRSTVSKVTTTVTAVKETTDALVERADSGEFDGADAVLLRIDSSRGTVFKNDEISTVLRAAIYCGAQRITDSAALHRAFGGGAYLQWSWQRMGEDTFGVILSTDKMVGEDGFTLTITSAEVDT